MYTHARRCTLYLLRSTDLSEPLHDCCPIRKITYLHENKICFWRFILFFCLEHFPCFFVFFLTPCAFPCLRWNRHSSQLWQNGLVQGLNIINQTGLGYQLSLCLLWLSKPSVIVQAFVLSGSRQVSICQDLSLSQRGWHSAQLHLGWLEVDSQAAAGKTCH